MSAEATPTAIERLAADHIRIVWSDGEQREYRARELREACPCATCREKKQASPTPPTQLTVLSAAEAQPVAIEGMRPVGGYAYNVAFTDGHSSGVYTFERLRGLGTAV